MRQDRDAKAAHASEGATPGRQRRTKGDDRLCVGAAGHLHRLESTAEPSDIEARNPFKRIAGNTARKLETHAGTCEALFQPPPLGVGHLSTNDNRDAGHNVPALAIVWFFSESLHAIIEYPTL